MKRKIEDTYEHTLPPSQPRVPSGVMKRKIEEIPGSDLGDEETAELGMEVDTDMTHEVRTTALVSLFVFFLFVCSRLVDITTDIS